MRHFTLENEPLGGVGQVLCDDAAYLIKEIPDRAIDVVLTDPVWPETNVDLPGKENCLETLQRVGRELPRITDRIILHLGLMTDPRILTAIPDTLPFVQSCWLRYIPPRYHGPILVEADLAYVFGHKRLPGDGSRVFGSSCVSGFRANKPHEARADPSNNHPCPRSIDHALWLVKRFSRPGDLILDPFCGSGTTLVAAKLTGRRYIGIDIDNLFVCYARTRLEKTPDPAPELFEPAGDRHTQESLLPKNTQKKT